MTASRSAPERSHQLSLSGGSAGNCLRRLYTGQSAGELVVVGKLVEREAVVVCSAALGRARPLVRRLARRVRECGCAGGGLTAPALPEPGAIPMTIQWTYRPLTASGSSTTSAAPNGADHASGGDTSAPLQVKSVGIGALLANAGLLIVSGPVPGAALVVPAPTPANASASASPAITNPAPCSVLAPRIAIRHCRSPRVRAPARPCRCSPAPRGSGARWARRRTARLRGRRGRRCRRAVPWSAG